MWGVRFAPKQRALIEHVADELGVSRAEAVRQLVDEGLRARGLR